MKKFLGFAIVLFCLQGSNSVPTPCSCVAPVECAEVVRIDGCSTYEVRDKDGYLKNVPIGYSNLYGREVTMWWITYEGGWEIETDQDRDCDGKPDGTTCVGGQMTELVPIGMMWVHWFLGASPCPSWSHYP